jgi:hypothetical protein
MSDPATPVNVGKGTENLLPLSDDFEEPAAPFEVTSKAKARSFEVNDLVYLLTPVTKPGLTRKFRKPWKGPYPITKKISDLNYELLDQRNKKSVVHVKRLKKAYNQDHLNSKPKP